MNSQFLIAAAHSGAGKTTVTLGMLSALRRKGYTVQPFKCGPDYIDPIHHRTAAGRDSINLDRFLMSDEHIRDLYRRHMATAAIGITEGVMGLFDGALKSEGSSADIARLLDIPVILVLNASAMAYSAAAILYGLKNFDRRLNVVGVIFNFVDSTGHYRLLTAACEDVGLTPLGYLPTNEGLRIPSRHLGLDTANAAAAIDAAADHIEKYVDLAALLRITEDISTILPPAGVAPTAGLVPMAGVARSADKKVLIARDEAFHFLYPENIRRLEEIGQVAFFSPVNDEGLPFRPDWLYLPGGYPELYLESLSANKNMLRQIRTYTTDGGRIIAECGGLMYLGRSITDAAGKTFPMADVLDIATSIQQKRLTIGYRTILVNGQTIKGHEFHFSQAVEDGVRRAVEINGEHAAKVTNAQGTPVDTPVFYRPGLLASYAHFYWGEDSSVLQSLLG